MEIVSANTNDSNAVADSAAGVKSVTIVYLDDNWIQRTINVALNGGTVAVPGTALRVNRMHSYTTGQWCVARCNITLRTTTGSTIEAPWTGQQTLRLIGAGGNMDMTALYTVPDRHTCYVSECTYSSGTAEQSIRLRANVEPNTRTLIQTNCFLFQNVCLIGANKNVTLKAEYLRFPAKSDIKVSVVPVQTSADTSCFVSLIEIEDRN